ncbi:hypothetical protein D8881_03395 [Streptococcus sanguinis]|jgi:hypothetical protein|uniref:Uncharacterized protein n=1 Tax=Streptococcus sanguinis TaxID=1305 RepID=A0ABD7JPH8_STRSA|nr:hypothetical protein D8881_03395 [Streptococcus sanguinis]RSI42743.1 hypothetical protein D8875_01505 [Streptococcus sanguinis]
MNETDSFRARLSFRFILLERKWNASWFVAAFVCYTHVYLVFVASVLSGLAGFLPVFAEKFLQGKARALFASSYLFAGSFYSSGELVSIETMRS